jgi:polyhydroxybutyrate depolymerase
MGLAAAALAAFSACDAGRDTSADTPSIPPPTAPTTLTTQPSVSETSPTEPTQLTSTPTTEPVSTAVACHRNQATGTANVDIPTATGSRQAIVHVPPQLDNDHPAPLILAFHGGGVGDGPFEATFFESLSHLAEAADQQGYIVAFGIGTGDPTSWGYPGSPDPPVPETDDIAYALALLDTLEASYCIAEHHVYAIGISDGGGLAARLACAASDRFDAIAVAAGIYTEDACLPDHAVPVIAFHGIDDPFVPYAGGLLAGSDQRVLPAEAWAQAWADRNGCGEIPLQPEVPSGVHATRWELAAPYPGIGKYGPEPCRAPVELYAYDALGHTWPSTSGQTPAAIDATDLTLAFFAATPANGKSFDPANRPALAAELKNIWASDQLSSLENVAGSALIHHDPSGWAVEDLDLGDGRWCRRAWYRWAVEDVVDWTHFKVRYSLTAEAPDCAPTGWTELVLDVAGSGRNADGARIFYGHYLDVLPGLVERHDCSNPVCGINTNLAPPTESPPS